MNRVSVRVTDLVMLAVNHFPVRRVVAGPVDLHVRVMLHVSYRRVLPVVDNVFRVCDPLDVPDRVRCRPPAMRDGVVRGRLTTVSGYLPVGRSCPAVRGCLAVYRSLVVRGCLAGRALAGDPAMLRGMAELSGVFDEVRRAVPGHVQSLVTTPTDVQDVPV